MELIIPLFVADAGLAAAPRFTTVPVLPSLVSLLLLTLRAFLVAGRDAGARDAAGAAARLVRVAAVVPLELELAFEVAVTFRAAPARVALAFSTMLDKTLVAVVRVGPEFFSGEAGRAMADLTGDAGRGRFRRELDEVGDKICAGRTSAPGLTRIRFLALSTKSFSLSPEIGSLMRF